MLGNEITRFDSIELLYYHLIQGNLTRHNLSRWIKPKPAESNNEFSDKTNVLNWKRKLEWHPIGEQIPGVRKFYEPEIVYAEKVHSFVFLPVFLLFLILTGLAAWSWELQPGNVQYPGIFGLFLKCRAGQQMIIFAVGMSISFAVGHAITLLLGPAIGSVGVWMNEDSIRRASDDGYVPTYDTKFTTGLRRDLHRGIETMLKSVSE
ncbi:MAG: hypothetical protein JSW66_17520 [Phycisphaerales bacterium]|nr:MAG: hypothetical protein JSW66_17520 [Phycisphaerales bacterium]